VFRNRARQLTSWLRTPEVVTLVALLGYWMSGCTWIRARASLIGLLGLPVGTISKGVHFCVKCAEGLLLLDKNVPIIIADQDRYVSSVRVAVADYSGFKGPRVASRGTSLCAAVLREDGVSY
jgi:hypothetical protein